MAMPELKRRLEESGYTQVRTYINSGNVLLQSEETTENLSRKVEKLITESFALDSALIKVLVPTEKQLQAVIEGKPTGFGEQPDKFYSDVIFLINIGSDEAFEVFRPREGVDTVWKGGEVIYSQRLGNMRSKSRLGKIIGTPAYKSMTIRSWNTVVKLLELSRLR